MTKHQADRFLHWLYKFIKNRTTFIRFKFMEEGTLAEYLAYNIDDEIDIYDIPIDPTGPILISIIHEGLHCLYPGKEEKEIEEMTVEVAEHLTEKQYRNLLVRLTEEILNGN